MTEQQMRDEFEVWIKKEHTQLWLHSNDSLPFYYIYAKNKLSEYFEVWKASREMLFAHTPPSAFMIKSGNKTVLTTSLVEAHKIADNYGGEVTCLYTQ